MKLRDEKSMGFKEIGDLFGISRSRSQQIYRQGHRLKRQSEPFFGLSTKSRNILINAGFSGKTDASNAIRSRSISLSKLRHCGKKSKLEILKWCDIPPSFDKRDVKITLKFTYDEFYLMTSLTKRKKSQLPEWIKGGLMNYLNKNKDFRGQ